MPSAHPVAPKGGQAFRHNPVLARRGPRSRRTPALQTRSPCSVVRSCQTPLKRTLKHPAWHRPDGALPHGGFGHHGESLVAANGCHMFDVRAVAEVPANRGSFAFGKPLQKPASRAFAQILGKLYFVQLNENLRRILVDYGQKRPSRTNAA